MCDEEEWGERVQRRGHERYLAMLSLRTVDGKRDWSPWQLGRRARRVAESQACTETMLNGRAHTGCLRAKMCRRKPWRQQCLPRRPEHAAKKNSCSVQSMAAV